jgi:hypothetical protein
MTKDEAMTKPLWEVWERFKAIHNYVETEKILGSFGKKGSDGLSHDGRDHGNDETETAMLREVLLERCKSVSDESGMASTAYFAETMEDDYSFSEKEMVCVNASDWCGQSAQLRNVAAACLFWAWELEQRQKTAAGGE